LTTKIKKQYASIIFYHNDEQKKIAEESREAEQLIRSNETIITQIVKAGIFYPAEKYVVKSRHFKSFSNERLDILVIVFKTMTFNFH
jgi:peptide-methionine (S)-S-oxide reductase